MTDTPKKFKKHPAKNSCLGWFTAENGTHGEEENGREGRQVPGRWLQAARAPGPPYPPPRISLRLQKPGLACPRWGHAGGGTVVGCESDFKFSGAAPAGSSAPGHVYSPLLWDTLMHSQGDLKCLCIMRAGKKQAEALLSPGAQTHNKWAPRENNTERKPADVRTAGIRGPRAAWSLPLRRSAPHGPPVPERAEREGTRGRHFLNARVLFSHVVSPLRPSQAAPPFCRQSHGGSSGVKDLSKVTY